MQISSYVNIDTLASLQTKPEGGNLINGARSKCCSFPNVHLEFARHETYLEI
jgi:hypothetical protein